MAAGSIVIDLLMKTGSFVTDTQRAEKSMRGLEKTAKSVSSGIGSAFAGIAAGIVAGLSIGSAVDTFVQGINTAIDSADRLDELSARFGTSTEQLAAWGYAAKMTGSDLEGLAGTIPKFSKSIADAADQSSEAAKTFKALGIEVRDQAGNLRSYEELLPEVADRFKDLDNVTTETAVAMQLFGRSGSEFLEFLNLGSDGLKTMEERARALGVVIDGETAGAAADFNDRLDDLRAATTGWFTQIAAALLPSITELVENMTEFVREGGNAKDVADSISGAFRGMSDAASGFDGVISGLDRVRGALAGLELQGNAAFQTFNPANWSSSGLARLGDQYSRGTQMVEQGWSAGQQTAPTGSAMPAGPRTGPRGRRSRATAEEVAETKAYAERVRRAEEWQKRLDAVFNNADKDPKKSPAARAAKAVKEELSETDKILKDLEVYQDVWADSAADVTREEQRRTDLYERMNADILEQIDLLGLTGEQQEAYNVLAWAGVDAESARGQELLGNLKRMQDLRDATYDQIDVMDGLRDSGRGFLADLEDGVKPIDALADAWDRFHHKLLDTINENVLDMIFGKQGDIAGGATGNWFSTVLGAFFGGAKAGGGDVFGGRAYLVGEEGPEAFIPRGAGTIVPADETAAAMRGVAGMSVTQVFNNPQMRHPRTEGQRQQAAAMKLRLATGRG